MPKAHFASLAASFKVSLIYCANQIVAQPIFQPFKVSIPLGILGALLLGGCSALPKLPSMPSLPVEYTDHIKRSSKHMGIYSHVEKTNQESPTPQYKLRVEGNSLVPTLDVERYFMEEAQHTCEDIKPTKPLHIIEQQKKITNTWQGSVYEIVGTFRCEEPPKENTPPAPPPSSLVPYDFSTIEKKISTETKETSTTKKVHKKKRTKKPLSKGCNCNPANKNPETTTPIPAKPNQQNPTQPPSPTPTPTIKLPAAPATPTLAPNSRAT
ncbi:MAG: hypothetical protein V4525_04680 [Pseudomonadota bacterium]